MTSVINDITKSSMHRFPRRWKGQGSHDYIQRIGAPSLLISSPSFLLFSLGLLRGYGVWDGWEGWIGVDHIRCTRFNTNYDKGGRLGGLRYHEGISTIRLGRLSISMTQVPTIPRGKGKKRKCATNRIILALLVTCRVTTINCAWDAHSPNMIVHI